jgi:uncharacterized membrane protein YoaK (UPF0700 family)
MDTPDPPRFIPTARLYFVLLLLAAIAGSVDVMSYFQFHTFTANMTGNTILLGISIGEGKFSSSMHSLTALMGFISGTFLGAFIVEKKEALWTSYITLSLAIETIIIAAFSALSFFYTTSESSYLLYLTIALSAIAMGMQSATIRYLRIPGIVTTFITGTITSIGMSVVQGKRKGFKRNEDDNLEIPAAKNLEQRIELQVMVLLAYGATAVITGWIEYHGSKFLPALPLLLIVSVLAMVSRFKNLKV